MHKSAREARFDIVVVGEINLDLILYGLPADMLPERELLGSGFTTTLGSSSAIVAHNLAVLGNHVGFVCMAGRDELGRIALDRLGRSGVDLSHTQFHPDMATGVTMLLPHGEQRHILTYAGTMAELRLSDLALDYVTDTRHFHLSSFFLQKNLQPDLPRLFRSLKQAGITISLDTNDDPEDKWRGVLDEVLEFVDILLPNEEEIKRISGQPTVEAALDVLASKVPLIAVKRGAQGATLQQGAHRAHIPGITVKPVDTIGAGDSFNAGFLHAWLGGADPHAAARMGNITGALSTLCPGGTEAFRDLPAVKKFLTDQIGSEYCQEQNV